MLGFWLLASVFFGIVILLVLILKLKIPAFIALLIASIAVGVFSGMHPLEIINTIKDGMGNTLGFVATVVGLGAMFGAILEHSGGAEALANYLLHKFGEKNASWALVITGFFVAIPVFFDVAFIILVPLIYSLQRKTKKSLLLYAIPLLAGLAITHAFIPPTPGPVAVADILKADLGWVILFGFIVGIPTAIVSGPLFSKYIAKKIFVEAPSIEKNQQFKDYPAVGLIIAIIGIPIVLIVSNTVLNSPLFAEGTIPNNIKNWLQMIGHPFSALIIANLIAWYLLGIKRGYHKETLLKITTKSMEAAGIIILLTGAGGVFKQVLINTGTGAMLANYFADKGISVLFFAFLAAVIVRVLQGSSTVAMITAAGITAPLLADSISEIDKALMVIAIAAGASIMSHVNDSGFWLVSKYLHIDEKQTFKSWSVMTILLSLVGFTSVMILSLIF
ncbi:gluconate transporter [Polaribacter reichenbachii]|uniref:Gluconate transporter n=1 Tax=Polaribacter reichenbachii TaxID=996801 RepID=A0A1B8U4N6_9FLAO|nr:gluconate:H+ symporter [Polaribacter reichenbachii]APZ44848.1 gluconate transporter [Polaribacter reichenbachii]AUC18712.1 gluconate transporter [Polaribacter reichenbachii]OBY66826.1 gluconate transporter [Polaribacter reichenbachii]